MIALSFVGAVIIASAEEAFCHHMNEDHHHNLFTPGVKSPAPFARTAGYPVFEMILTGGKA
jgi:hypothetical protein